VRMTRASYSPRLSRSDAALILHAAQPRDDWVKEVSAIYRCMTAPMIAYSSEPNAERVLFRRQGEKRAEVLGRREFDRATESLRGWQANARDISHGARRSASTILSPRHFMWPGSPPPHGAWPRCAPRSNAMSARHGCFCLPTRDGTPPPIRPQFLNRSGRGLARIRNGHCGPREERSCAIAWYVIDHCSGH
jgi:hypothetical protein